MAEKSMKLTGKPVKNTPLVPADMLFILDSEDSDAIKRVPQTSFKGEKGDDGAPGPGISVKGSVDTVGDLPTGAEAGDAYVVRENGDLYISDGADNWAVADITGFVYKGTWDGATEYEPDDVVTYDGSAYFCILGGNMGELPDTPGSIYWTLFLSKGADGSPGEDGKTGADGATGEDGQPGESVVLSRNATHIIKKFSGDPDNGAWSDAGLSILTNASVIAVDESGSVYTFTGKTIYKSLQGGYAQSIGVAVSDQNMSWLCVRDGYLYVSSTGVITSISGVAIGAPVARYDISSGLWEPVAGFPDSYSVRMVIPTSDGGMVAIITTTYYQYKAYKYLNGVWSDLSISFSSAVFTVMEKANGDLVFTGLFSTVNGVSSNNMAGIRSSDGAVIVMPFPISSTSIPVSDRAGNVYMYGYIGGEYRIYKWTESLGWSIYLNAGTPVVLYVDRDRGLLFALGTFSSIGGVTAQNVAYCSLDGDQAWHAMGTGVTGSPFAGSYMSKASFYGDKLIVSGRFTDAGGTVVSNIALWESGFVELIELSELKGDAGAAVHNGTVDPGTGDWKEGDFYINTVTWQIFGPFTPTGGWGSGIDLLGADGAPGANGTDGASSYTAIAYADDDLGTGFTMTFDPSKDYIAIKTSASPIPENPAQFAGLWKYYAGGSAPAVETAPEGLYTCDAGGSYGINLASADTEYSLPLTEVIGDGLALGEYDDSVVVDYDKALFYRCLHNICGNITPDKACTITLKLYQDDVLQRSRSTKVFDMGGGFAPVLAVLNYITEGVTGGTEIMLTLSADIDDVWAEVEDLNHNMTFRQYTPEDELPEGAFLDEEGGAFIDEEGSFFIDGE